MLLFVCRKSWYSVVSLCRCSLFPSRVGLRTYQHPWTFVYLIIVVTFLRLFWAGGFGGGTVFRFKNHVRVEGDLVQLRYLNSFFLMLIWFQTGTSWVKLCLNPRVEQYSYQRHVPHISLGPTNSLFHNGSEVTFPWVQLPVHPQVKNALSHNYNPTLVSMAKSQMHYIYVSSLFSLFFYAAIRLRAHFRCL